MNGHTLQLIGVVLMIVSALARVRARQRHSNPPR